MKIISSLFCFFLIFSGINACNLEHQEIFSLKKNGEILNRKDITRFFKFSNPTFNNQFIVTDPLVLQDAARSALLYFKSKKKSNEKLLNPKIFSSKIANFDYVKKTLEFIIWSIEKDKQKKSSFRILDTKFLEKNFKFIRWFGDVNNAQKNKVKIPENLDNGKIPNGKIRLTNYAVFVLNGRSKRSKNFPCALYAIRNKEFESKDRFKYTKQDIFNRALHNRKNKNRVKPLVWLKKDDLETAMMQGTTYVRMPDNKKRLFCVDKNNGFAYDKKISNPSEQKRYWYFKEISKKQFFEKNGFHLKHKEVIFAGDVHNIGLGKLIAIKYQNPVSKKNEMRIGILADTGGAFKNNLYQLDFFGGVDSKYKFKKRLQSIPNTVEAYILVKK
ncbi:hypothetical protein ACFLYH_01085 [Candidatus Dependentiae bacterium]